MSDYTEYVENGFKKLETCKALAKKFPEFVPEEWMCRFSQEYVTGHAIDGAHMNRLKTEYDMTHGWDFFMTYNENQGGYKMAEERVPYFTEGDLLRLSGKEPVREKTWHELAQDTIK